MDLRIFVEPQQGATYDDQLAVARTAEAGGFGAFFRSDHYLAMNVEGLPGPTDAWTTLAGLARETSTIRLGTLVSSATFRHPGPLAVTVAQVDQMSGGRVDFGLGAGWYAAEHEAYAIPFPDLRERFDRLTEQLAVISGLWTTPVGEKFSYSGDHYTVTDSPALPKPVQSPAPPIVIGGAGKKRSAALAAQYAAEFNVPFAPVEDVEAAFGRVRAALYRPGPPGRRPDVLSGAGGVRRTFRRRADPPSRQHRARARRSAPRWSGGFTGRDRGQDRHLRGDRRHKDLLTGARHVRPRARRVHRRDGDPATLISQRFDRVSVAQ